VTTISYSRGGATESVSGRRSVRGGTVRFPGEQNWDAFTQGRRSDGDVTGRCTRAMAESGDVHAMYPDSGQQMTRGVADATTANSDFLMIERGEVGRVRVTWAFRII
jgi:hypothetical protein